MSVQHRRNAIEGVLLDVTLKGVTIDTERPIENPVMFVPNHFLIGIPARWLDQRIGMRVRILVRSCFEEIENVGV